jgi:hypothetical protein
MVRVAIANRTANFTANHTANVVDAVFAVTKSAVDS